MEVISSSLLAERPELLLVYRMGTGDRIEKSQVKQLDIEGICNYFEQVLNKNQLISLRSYAHIIRGLVRGHCLQTAYLEEESKRSKSSINGQDRESASKNGLDMSRPNVATSHPIFEANFYSDFLDYDEPLHATQSFPDSQSQTLSQLVDSGDGDDDAADVSVEVGRRDTTVERPLIDDYSFLQSSPKDLPIFRDADVENPISDVFANISGVDMSMEFDDLVDEGDLGEVELEFSDEEVADLALPHTGPIETDSGSRMRTKTKKRVKFSHAPSNVITQHKSYFQPVQHGILPASPHDISFLGLKKQKLSKHGWIRCDSLVCSKLKNFLDGEFISAVLQGERVDANQHSDSDPFSDAFSEVEQWDDHSLGDFDDGFPDVDDVDVLETDVGGIGANEQAPNGFGDENSDTNLASIADGPPSDDTSKVSSLSQTSSFSHKSGRTYALFVELKEILPTENDALQFTPWMKETCSSRREIARNFSSLLSLASKSKVTLRKTKNDFKISLTKESLLEPTDSQQNIDFLSSQV